MTHLIKMISMALITTGLFSTPALAKDKPTLDDLNCTQEGAIAKISGGEWVCGEDEVGTGGAAPLWTVLDANNIEVGVFVGIRHNSTGSINGGQQWPSIDVFLDIGGDQYLAPTLGSGFGSTASIQFDGAGCSGMPAFSASDINRDSSFGALYGKQSFIAPDAVRTLYEPVGIPVQMDVVSVLSFDGTCWELGTPSNESVYLLNTIAELHSIFTPPFRMEPGF